MIDHRFYIIAIAVFSLSSSCIGLPPTSGEAPSDERLERRVSLALRINTPFGVHQSGLEDQLRDAGFDDNSPRSCLFGSCSGGHAHPREIDTAVGLGIAGRLAVRRRIAVGAEFGWTNIGGSRGYRDDGSLFGTFISSSWMMKTGSGCIFFTPNRRIRFGGGVSVHFLRGDGVREGGQDTLTRVGGVLEAGVEIPIFHAFVDVVVQYHAINSKDIEYGNADVGVVLRHKWSYASADIGLGYRF
jgi:hypothetical protein